eukprot:scaffold224818_cov33-Tisochrysis_lutea.AAC.5
MKCNSPAARARFNIQHSEEVFASGPTTLALAGPGQTRSLKDYRVVLGGGGKTTENVSLIAAS